MGVQGLWKLLSPAGRRVKIETLNGKILAIDVSIWLLKMIHGYLQLGSEEYRNVHLTGIFRRIVKLLYYNIRPVFVFDGRFPELKRETVRKRQEFREKRRVDLKKVAQKYLSKVLEERLRESVGKVMAPKNPLKNMPRREEPVQEEEEEMKIEEENEENVFGEEGQEQLYDYEFDFIVDQNKELLEEDGIDLEEFYLQDTETQYEIVKRVKNKLKDRKIKKYLEIDSLDDYSKVHIEDYVKHIQKKHKLEKMKEEASAKRMEKEHELALGDEKLKIMMQNQHLKDFFLAPKKQVIQGSLASDRNKKFMYLTQKNEAFDAQTMRIERKRDGKHERSKKLNAQLRNIGQHADNGPHYFSFDELLADNPLEAFRHSKELELKGGSAEKIAPIRNKEKVESPTEDVDIDEVFGFDEWDQKPEETPTVQDEAQETTVKGGGEVEQNEHASDLDLFDFKVEDLEETEQEKSKGVEYEKWDEKDMSGKSSMAKNMLVENEDDQLIQLKDFVPSYKKDLGLKPMETQEIGGYMVRIFTNEPQGGSQEEKKTVVSKVENKKESSQISTPQVIKKEEKLKSQESTSSKTQNQSIRSSLNNAGESTKIDIEEEQEKKSPETTAKKVVKTKPVSNSNTGMTWFQRLVSENSSQAIKAMPLSQNLQASSQGIQASPKEQMSQSQSQSQAVIEEEEKTEEIMMSKEPQENMMGNTQDLKNEVEKVFGGEFNWDNFDEEKLVDEMKELDDPDQVDKWALMEEFQKFRNLSDFEAGSIQEKFDEIKELLVMFGIPWVDSPTEAEAQCSFLEQSGLVNGIITDDSDVFLFGGRNVYRNIFEKGDFAHAYKMNYIENDMGLTREQLILLAMFLGSDYTLGIRGVGIVNAMEIVTAFDTVDALKRFREWAEVPDVLLENASEHYRDVPQKELEYKLYHRNWKKHWELPDNFPDKRVVEGYTKPTVDESQEHFQWGKPDFTNLEKYCQSKFQWKENQVYDLLEPLKRAIAAQGGQNKITDYFKEEKIAVVNSKRMNEAIKNLKDKYNEEREMPATITKSIENILQKQNPSNIKKRKNGDYEGELIKQFAFDLKKFKKNP